MKVLMLVTKLNTGGTEKYILSVARYLMAHGVQVGVASRRGPLLKQFVQAGIQVHLLPPNRNLMRTQLQVLSSILNDGGYDLIHAHDTESYRYASILHAKHAQPIIATIHGTYHGRVALQSIARVARRLIVISQNLSSWLMESVHDARGKVVYIPNGINTTFFKPNAQQLKARNSLALPPQAQLAIYAGRVSPDKFPIAVKMVLSSEQVAKNNPRYVAVIFGAGAPHNRLKLNRLAANVNRRLGRQAIIVRMAIPNIQRAYHAADVVVGTGRVAMEALSCGKPVIAAGVAGYCGIVRKANMNRVSQANFGDHGATGPITVEQLTKDLTNLIQAPLRLKRLGQYGAKTIQERFTLEEVGARIMEEYRSVMVPIEG
ncbi:glycosyltransferase family 4 protein [Paenibacillus sp. N1-5-1-14]|uniref:glycosyltransferase family 4 protein n=1 Tax=Paenibacillus radicibacter TaxID=2972488 RepID=UPI0021596639|nr:glycosyltransferase family 4 protein [Paenibacillus radicibacter]MCR8641642.1 glycosyltransferase family 4 protein [Paenibacillus radicibacter]